MQVTKRKLGPGRYRVLVGGRDTALLIMKGEVPKYRMPQQWEISKELNNGDIAQLCSDQRGLDCALGTIRSILTVLEPAA